MMKNVRLLLIAVIGFSVFFLTSCLDGNEQPNQYGITVTVKTGGYLGTTIELLTDYDDLTLIPVNVADDIWKNVERAYVVFSVVNDDPIIAGKSRYEVNVHDYILYNTKDILEIPEEGSSADTLQDVAFDSFYSMQSYAGYVNTITYVAYNNNKPVYVDMVKEKISNDTLYLKLNLNANEGSLLGIAYTSFRVPTSKIELENEGAILKGDSIYVAVSAKQRSSTQVRYSKYKLN